MLLLESQKSDSFMYPYSLSATPTTSVVVAPESDAANTMLISGHSQNPSAMLYTPHSYVATASQKPVGFLNNGNNSNNGTSDIMSHSVIHSSTPQQPNSNTNSFYSWSPPQPATAKPTQVIDPSRLLHGSQRRGGGRGGTSYRISPHNPPADFPHPHYFFRQQHPPSSHKTESEASAFVSGSSKPVGNNTSTTNWKERPHVGKYSLIRTIGKGNFAKVKLAQHVTTGMEVAVKVIDKTQLNPTSLRKLFREVRIMKTLDHPNIIKLLEVIESEKHLYLVMEYASQGEVFDYLVTHGKMKEKDARNKFRQIVSAVQYCHAKSIVHRDLKAENLLLDESLNLKIADFGFSNNYSSARKLDTFCGSPPYAAPELFLGRKYDGPEVDVWSLGVILYTLVSGSLPFDGKNLKELRECVLRGSYRVPFYMSHECEMLLRKMLVLNPTKRASLLDIMKDKWLNMSFEEQTMQPFKEDLPDYNDNERIQWMVQMGFSRGDIHDALSKQLFNNITATYILLGQRRQKALPWPATPASGPPQRSLSSEMPAFDGAGSVHNNNNGGTRQHSTGSFQPSRHLTATTTTNAAFFRRPFHPVVTPTLTDSAGRKFSSNTAEGSVVAGEVHKKPSLSPGPPSVASVGGGGQGKIRPICVEGDASIANAPLATTDVDDVKGNPSAVTGANSPPSSSSSGTLKRQSMRTDSHSSTPAQSGLNNSAKFSTPSDAAESGPTPSITLLDSRNGRNRSHVATSSSQATNRNVPAVPKRTAFTHRNTVAGVEGDLRVPILAPRASDATVVGTETSLSGRMSRRDEPVAPSSLMTGSRPQPYELINSTALDSSLLQQQQQQDTTEAGVSGVSNSRVGGSFSRNHSSFEYRSLRLPMDTASELVRSGANAAHYNVGGVAAFPSQSTAISANTTAAVAVALQSATINSSSPTSAAAVDNRRPAAAHMGGGGGGGGGVGGFYVPFGRNVPGRSTIQHVPPTETRDRLALERPDQWSRPLTRHPGTAAHMDQKTTLADLYSQNGNQIQSQGRHSPSDLSVISITSSSTATKGGDVIGVMSTTDAVDNEFDYEDDDDDDDDEGDIDVDECGGHGRIGDNEVNDYDDECSATTVVGDRCRGHHGRGKTGSRFSRGGTPVSLQETSSAVVKLKASTFSKLDAKKTSSTGGTGGGGGGGGSGFLRNLSMRISRSKIFRLPFSGGTSIPPQKEKEPAQDYSTLRSLRGASGSSTTETFHKPLTATKIPMNLFSTPSSGITRSRSTVTTRRGSTRAKSPAAEQHTSRRSTIAQEGQSDRASRDTTPTNTYGRSASSSRGAPPNTASLIEHSIQSGGGGAGSGNARVLFHMDSSSRRQLDEMMAEIKRTLLSSGVAFSQTDHPHRLHCTWMVGGGGATTPETDLDSILPAKTTTGSGDILRLELEVCRLPKAGMNGVRFKRLAGPAAEFKRISQKLADDLKL